MKLDVNKLRENTDAAIFLVDEAINTFLDENEAHQIGRLKKFLQAQQELSRNLKAIIEEIDKGEVLDYEQFITLLGTTMFHRVFPAYLDAIKQGINRDRSQVSKNLITLQSELEQLKGILGSVTGETISTYALEKVYKGFLPIVAPSEDFPRV